MLRMPARLLAPAVLASMLATHAAKAEEVTIAAKFDAWTVFLYESGGARLCFAALPPRLSEPTTAKRDAIYFYATSWPADGVTAEISVKMGYTIKKGSTVTVAAGASAFRLAAKDDRAFLAESAEEKRLVEALRKGGSMTVSGESERGTKTKDTYPLAGAGPALDMVGRGCT